MHTQEKLAQVCPLIHPQHQVQRDHHLLPAVGDAGDAQAPSLGHAGERWMRPQKAHLERGGKAVRGVALDPEDECVIATRVHIGQGEFAAAQSANSGALPLYLSLTLNFVASIAYTMMRVIQACRSLA